MKKVTVSFLFFFSILLLSDLRVQGQDSSSTSGKGFTPLKTFQGAKNYRKWSLGVGVGGLAPVIGFGGKNQFSKYNIDLGYSAFIKYQIQHSFGIRLDYLGGRFTGVNSPSSQNPNFITGNNSGQEIHSSLTYGLSVKGEVDVAALDFLRRQNAVRVFLTAGYGLAGYKPDNYGGNTIKAGFVPLGAGVKIKASEALAFNLGYEVYFFDGSNLLGKPYVNGDGRQSKASYGSVGVEYIFGAKGKRAMIWTNPLAITYDELKSGDSLAKEVDGLKSRVGTLEGDVDRLKKDTDGDGVSDVFDKCPNTPKGVKVDGGGCDLPPNVITRPYVDTLSSPKMESMLQFDFNSANIKPSSQSFLDSWASKFNQENSRMIELKGYASSEGNPKYNLILSKRRARSVRDYYINKGISGRKIKATGNGINNPVSSNDSEEGRSKNRRVEISLH